MRTVFLGTPQFAVPSLRALAEAGHQLAAVFTQPDRPKGRGNVVTESPVKVTAQELAIPVHQPERIRRPESVNLLRELAPELGVVVGYGQIIPQTIIDIPRYGILNVHASLLPKYRGAAPIQWAIANGEERTGVTIMQIDAGLDTGDMLLWADTAIGQTETAPELSIRLASLGAQLLTEAIKQIQSGTAQRHKQNAAEATLAPILKKEDASVDWSRPAQSIYSRLRGFTPWPGAYTSFRGQQLSIVSAVPASHTGLEQAVIKADKGRLYAGCGDDSTLELLEVQLPGKKRMTAQAFSNGYKPEPGERLGEPA
jgi:methionyl-tRNA formyltransferase